MRPRLLIVRVNIEPSTPTVAVFRGIAGASNRRLPSTARMYGMFIHTDRILKSETITIPAKAEAKSPKPCEELHGNKSAENAGMKGDVD